MSYPIARRWQTPAVAALACVVALAYQGARGIWEPDEGYYSNAALAMAQGGSLLVPEVDGRIFLDKPPLDYWAIAAGLSTLGQNEWGLRVPHALFFIGSVLVVGLLAAAIYPGCGPAAALVYATMLLPVAGASTITPDAPLAFWCALAYYAYYRASRDETGRSLRWWLVAGAAAGLGILTKGPALLVCTFPMGIELMVDPRRRRGLATPGPWMAALLAAVVGGSWYAYVATEVPGAWPYIWDNQIAGRLANEHYRRNPGALGLLLYVMTVVVGTQPWSALVGLGVVGRRAEHVAPGAGAGRRLLLVWMLMPFAIFLAASSRLPLYLLPLAAPLAVLLGSRLPGALLERRVGGAALVTVLALVGLKGAAASWPTELDARALASELPTELARDGTELVFFSPHAGLRFYGFPRVEIVSVAGHSYPFFHVPQTAREEALELPSADHPHAFVLRSDWLPWIERLTTEVCPDCRCAPTPGPDGMGIFRCEPRHEESKEATPEHG